MTAQGHSTVLLAQEATLRLTLAGDGEGATPLPEAGTALITWSASRLPSPRDT